jgi:tetratricopeptide (TPR) repeat protein
MNRTAWIAASAIVFGALVLLLLPTTPDSGSPESAEVAVSPLDAKVREAVRLIQEGTGNPMEAIALLREVVEADPQHRDGLFHLGEFSRMSGQLDRALDRYASILQYYPNDHEAAVRYAETLADLGRRDEARQFVAKYLTDHPNADLSSLTQLRDSWTEGDAEAPAGSEPVLTH